MTVVVFFQPINGGLLRGQYVGWLGGYPKPSAEHFAEDLLVVLGLQKVELLLDPFNRFHYVQLERGRWSLTGGGSPGHLEIENVKSVKSRMINSSRQEIQ